MFSFPHIYVYFPSYLSIEVNVRTGQHEKSCDVEYSALLLDSWNHCQTCCIFKQHFFRLVLLFRNELNSNLHPTHATTVLRLFGSGIICELFALLNIWGSSLLRAQDILTTSRYFHAH